MLRLRPGDGSLTTMWRPVQVNLNITVIVLTFARDFSDDVKRGKKSKV